LRNSFRPFNAHSLALAICLTPAWVLAQQAPVAPDTAKKDRADDPLSLETVVVTGATVKNTKFKTAYGITTLDADQISDIKPTSAMALYSNVPGVFSDGNGGESSGNLFLRGLPSNGGFKFVPLLQDGLPVYYEPEVGFMNPDTFVRISPMIERVEFVRGGPSSVFYSHATAGAFNHLNRRGTTQLEGEFSQEFGSNNRLKTSGYVSGPINDRWSFATGGYYRTDDAQRSPGFTGNHGGEWKSALTFRDAGTTASLYAYLLNDHTYFQTNLPFLNSGDASNIKPQSIPGLDVKAGTLASTDLQRVTLWQGGKPLERDLGDGIHSNFKTVGGELFHDFGNGWKLEARSRLTTGSNDFNGMFSGGTQLGTDAVATSANNPYWVNLKAAAPSVASLQLRYLNEPGKIFDVNGANGNGRIAPQGWWRGLITVDNFTQEFRETKTFEALGTHNVTFGQFFSFAKLHSEMNLNFGSLLTELKSQPKVLELVGLDAAGNVAAKYTHNGFTTHAGFLLNQQDETRATALFVNDAWKVSDNLRLDGGLRVERVNMKLNHENTEVVDLRGTATVNGSTDYAFKNVNVLNGNYTSYSPSFKATSWSVGADYTWSPNIGTFARYSQPQRLPRTEDGWFGIGETMRAQKLNSAELGLKLNYPEVAALISAYMMDYKSYPFYSYTVNATTGERVPKLTMGSTRSTGIESELVWRPGRGPFDVALNLTLAKSTFKNFHPVDQNIDGLGNVITTDNDFSGKRVPRVPRLIYQLTPGYNFDVAGMSGRVFATYRYVGDRFTAADNMFKMPGYAEVSVGANLDLSERLRLQLNVQNVTGSTGFVDGGCQNCGSTSTSSNVLGANTPIYEGRPILPRAAYLTASYRY
jgi:outer membrane receptor protein involved in Fe transport